MKKKIGVWIPHEEVWNEFTELVKDKWGKKHSVLGLELEEAIKAYMNFKKSGTWGDEEKINKEFEKLNKRVDAALKKKEEDYNKMDKEIEELKKRVYHESLEE